MPAPGLFDGFDHQEMNSITGFITGTGVTFSTSAADKHVDLTGNLTGLASAFLTNGDDFRIGIRRTDIPWEEVVFEHWIKYVGGSCNFFLRSTSGIECNIRFFADNLRYLRGTTTTLATGTGLPVGDTGFYSHLITLGNGTSGLMKSWKDGILALTASGIDNVVTTASCEALQADCAAGANTMYLDDMGFRPRTILVDGVTSADTATPTAITGSPSATVYAWENDSTDSASGSGDPSLAAGEWRLYLKDVSFGPEESGVGWANNDSVTVTGLTGTIQVNAPNAAFHEGMEPGSQFFFQKLHVIAPTISGTGTDNTAGTLVGSPTDRADALDTEGDGLAVRHTATAESVTVNTTDLTAGEQAAILEVYGVQATVIGATDGGSPNALKCRVLDNGGSAQESIAITVGGSNTTVSAFFPENGSGGQWSASGTGAGTLNSSEIGYTTA